MPMLSDLIGSITVDKTMYKNPQWWNAKHKLNKAIKDIDIENVKNKKKILVGVSKSSLENQPDMDTFSQEMKSKLEFARYDEFAPWNPMFQKQKPFIFFND